MLSYEDKKLIEDPFIFISFIMESNIGLFYFH